MATTTIGEILKVHREITRRTREHGVIPASELSGLTEKCEALILESFQRQISRDAQGAFIRAVLKALTTEDGPFPFTQPHHRAPDVIWVTPLEKDCYLFEREKAPSRQKHSLRVCSERIAFHMRIWLNLQ